MSKDSSELNDKENLGKNTRVNSKNQIKKILASLTIVLIIGITSFYIYQSGFSHEVKVNGKIVGYVKDLETVDEALTIVEENVARQYGKDAYFHKEIKTEKVRGYNEERIEVEELDKSISRSVEILKPASIVKVDKKEKIIVESEKDAESILDEIKDVYVKEKEAKEAEEKEEEKDKKEILDVYFKQEVEIVDKDVPVNEIFTKDEVLIALELKEGELKSDRIARGDSALNVTRTLSSRTGKKEEGKEENINKEEEKNPIESLVDVVMVERHRDTEEIDFKVTERKDPSIFKDQRIVHKEGEKGKKEILTDVTYVNGEETEKNLVKETVKKEPQDKVILIGMKDRPKPVVQAKTSPKKSAPAPTYNGDLGASIAATAKNYIGVPYVWGGNSPSGFDCSGLTSYVYRQYGISIPRTSSGQGSTGTYIPRDQLMPGDLVSFPGHVGIYVGGGNFIHAPRRGDNVKITSLNSSYYSGRFLGGRRPY